MTRRRLLTNADLASGSVGAADWDYAWDEVWNTADPAAGQARQPRRSHRTLWTSGLSGLAVILAVSGYIGSAWMAADGLLHALGRRDTLYLKAHLDTVSLLAGLERDLRHLAAEATAGRNFGNARESTYLDRLARGTASALRNPEMLGMVIQARITNPGFGNEALDVFGSGSQQIVADGLTSFHVAFAGDRNSASGMSLCFALEDFLRLDWRLVQIGWPELGGSCRGKV